MDGPRVTPAAAVEHFRARRMAVACTGTQEDACPIYHANLTGPLFVFIGGERREIRVRLASEDRESRRALESMWIATPKGARTRRPRPLCQTQYRAAAFRWRGSFREGARYRELSLIFCVAGRRGR